MERSTIAVVHPELDEQRRIGEVLKALGHPIAYAADWKGLSALFKTHQIGLLVAQDLRLPMDRPAVVESVQRTSLKVPVIVLLAAPDQAKCPEATRLLMGLQHYLVWPEEAAELPTVAKGFLRTARLLQGAPVDPGDPAWIPSLREAGTVQERRELIAALSATKGNISRAAEILGISRGGLQYRLRKHGISAGAARRRGSLKDSEGF